MATQLTYTDLASKAAISPSYAHQIMNGVRKPPLPLALRIYDATGMQFGGLEGLTKRQIDVARQMAA